MIRLFFLFALCQSLAGASHDSFLVRQRLHFERFGEEHFRAHAPGYSLDLSAKGVRIFSGTNALDIQFVEATGPKSIRPEEPLCGVVNHLIGSDPAHWRTGLSTFGRVRLSEVYPGIDVVFYGNGLEIQYDIEVAPGVPPNSVAIDFPGADSVRLEPEGNLRLQIGSTELRQSAPVVYQVQNGARVPVESKYELNSESRVSFRLGSYDSSAPLVIDPVVQWSTFFGGTSQNEVITDVAVDADGNIYVTGQTYMTGAGDLPLQNATQDQNDPIFRDGGGQLIISRNAFVSSFSPDGQLRFSTYLGGRRDELATAIATGRGSSPGVYVTGWTASVTGGQFIPTTFPLTPGAFLTNKTEVDSDAIFLTKLTANGAMVYSTLLFPRMASGTSYELKVDDEGRAYVGGYVESGEFPGTRPGGGSIVETGAFIFAVNAQGAGAIYANRLASLGRTLAIAVETNGVAHIGGFQSGLDFQSTPEAYDSEPGFSGSGFYQKLSPEGSVLYSTRLRSLVEDAALLADGTVLLAGGESMLTRLDPAKPRREALVSTLDLGGTGLDVIKAIDVDKAGNIFVAGHTDSADLPTVNPSQTNLAGGTDVFVAQLNPAASGVSFLSYLGGSRNEPVDGEAHLMFYRIALGVAVDPKGNFFVVAGGTDSPDFPTLAPFQGSIKGGTSGFITRFGVEKPRDVFVVNSADDIDDGACDTVHCSLREAIRAANQKEGVQTIEFNIAGQGVPVISPRTRLPSISQSIVVDGTTQPGARLIEIEGSQIAAPGVDGVQLQARDSVLRGLVINRFTGNGIFINGGSDNTVTQCRIGVDPTGGIARPNALAGVLIEDGSGNSIGEANAPLNIVSANAGDGIRIRGASSHRNQIVGNFIGTNERGDPHIGNGGDGVLILGGTGNRIGSELSGANTISGNSSNGVTIASADTSETVLARNYIGLSPDAVELPNEGHGVEIRNSSRNVVGGSSEASFNFVSGNLGSGVLIQGESSVGNRIEGNVIGLKNFAGDLAPNRHGVTVLSGDSTRIGGPASKSGFAPGNVISGNKEKGVHIQAEALGTVIQGNVIGTDRGTGVSALPNHTGVLSEAAGTQIGGPNAEHRNVISGNSFAGIVLHADGTVQGNYIGLNADGSRSNGNGDRRVPEWRDFHADANVTATIGGELPSGASAGRPPGNVIGANLSLIGNRRSRVLGNIIGSDATGSKHTGLGELFVSGTELIVGSPKGPNVISGPLVIHAEESIFQANLIGLALDGKKFENSSALVRLRAGKDNLIGGRRAGEGNKIVGGARGIENFVSQENSFLGNEIREFTDSGITQVPSASNPPRIHYAGPLHNSGISEPVVAISVDPFLPGEAAELEIFRSPKMGANGNAEAHELVDRVLLPQFGLSANAIVPAPQLKPGDYVTATLTRRGKATSSLSPPTAFALGADSDQDGVADALESSADGNKDGIADNQQAGAITVPAPGGFLTVAPPAGTRLVEFTTRSGLPPIKIDGQPIRLTLGLEFHVKVQFVSPENRGFAMAQQKLSLPVFLSGFAADAWLIYGRTFENLDRHWRVFEHNGTSGAEFLGDRVILHLVDGEWEDEQGFVDGLIEFTGTFAILGDAPPRIVQFAPLAGRDFLLQWSGPISIELQQSPDLLGWISAATNESGANPAMIFPAPENPQQHFFRLRTQN